MPSEKKRAWCRILNYQNPEKIKKLASTPLAFTSTAKFPENNRILGIIFFLANPIYPKYFFYSCMPCYC
jgi:hypothetical protein